MARLVDNEWLIRGNKVTHMCAGNQEINEIRAQQGIKKLKGFWPVKEKKCVVCDKEITKQVEVILNSAEV